VALHGARLGPLRGLYVALWEALLARHPKANALADHVLASEGTERLSEEPR
jgi:hypothetical protein